MQDEGPLRGSIGGAVVCWMVAPKRDIQDLTPKPMTMANMAEDMVKIWRQDNCPLLAGQALSAVTCPHNRETDETQNKTQVKTKAETAVRDPPQGTPAPPGAGGDFRGPLACEGQNFCQGCHLCLVVPQESPEAHWGELEAGSLE